MSDDTLDLVEFPCPDCDTFWNRSFPGLRAGCKTCGGSGKVLVKRENLIRVK